MAALRRAPGAAAAVTGVAVGRGTLGLLRDRTFGPYFFASLVSNSGTWFQNVAAAIVVFELTGSAVAVGGVGAAQFAASLVLAPWAGAVVDRRDRRRILLGAQLLAGSAAGCLALWAGSVGLSSPWPVLAAALLIGVGNAFTVPAMQALVPALVPPTDLDGAIGLNAVTFNLGRAIGPALGAAAVVAFGPAAAFAVNTASFVPLIVVLALIRPRAVVREAGRDGSVRAGLRFVRADRTLAMLLLAVAALGFGSDPVTTLTPSLAAVLDRGDHLVGWLVSAFGIGAVIATVLTGRGARRPGRLRQRAVGGLALLGLGMLAVAVSPTAPLALTAVAIAGAGFLVALTALTTEIQQRVTETVRGRVMALWGLAFLGSRPLAAALDGAVADLTSPRLATGVAGGIALTTALFMARATASARPSGDL